LIRKCLDDENENWSSKWLAFQNNAPPSLEVASLFDNCAVFEPLHMLMTVGNLVATETAVLAKDMLGRAGICTLVETLKGQEITPRYAQEIESWEKSGCKKDSSLTMPR
jgi:hypothetical protein